MKTPCDKCRWCVFKEDSSLCDWRHQYYCNSFHHRIDNPDPVVGIKYILLCSSMRKDPEKDCKYFEVRISKQVGSLEKDAVHEK